ETFLVSHPPPAAAAAVDFFDNAVAAAFLQFTGLSWDAFSVSSGRVAQSSKPPGWEKDRIGARCSPGEPNALQLLKAPAPLSSLIASNFPSRRLCIDRLLPRRRSFAQFEAEGGDVALDLVQVVLRDALPFVQPLAHHQVALDQVTHHRLVASLACKFMPGATAANVCGLRRPYLSFESAEAEGQSDAASDCISNKMQITFASSVNSCLDQGLLHWTEPWTTLGEFHAQIAQLPRPFLFTDRVDFSDSERTKSIELNAIVKHPAIDQFFITARIAQNSADPAGPELPPGDWEMLNCRGSVCNTGMQRPHFWARCSSAKLLNQWAQQANLTLIVTLSCLLALDYSRRCLHSIIIVRGPDPAHGTRWLSACETPRRAPTGLSAAAGLCQRLLHRPDEAAAGSGGVVTATAVAREAHRPESDVYETPEEPALPPGVAVPPPLPAEGQPVWAVPANSAIKKLQQGRISD
uniref:VASt domain-containing protein n=1 Tax=Macrostomum lignano TaxID=282301 RepID=A0A1I8FPI8_9PLAT